MKEANENILRLLLSNIEDSIIVLEKYLHGLKATHLLKPAGQCFTNINSETGEYDLVWSNGEQVDLCEFNILIKYDLAQYYFINENYRKCFDLLDQCDFKFHTNNKYLNGYCVNIESLQNICGSLFNQKKVEDADQNKQLPNAIYAKVRSFFCDFQ
jgi:hypothetical protein